jgi:hypothetical protein
MAVAAREDRRRGPSSRGQGADDGGRIHTLPALRPSFLSPASSHVLEAEVESGPKAMLAQQRPPRRPAPPEPPLPPPDEATGGVGGPPTALARPREPQWLATGVAMACLRPWHKMLRR